MKHSYSRLFLIGAAVVSGACGLQRWQPAKSTPVDDHASHDAMAPGMTMVRGPVRGSRQTPQGVPGIPAGGTDAAARLQASPRKGSYVAIPYEAGSKDSLMVWVSMPAGAA